jgi:hypothetical protein
MESLAPFLQGTCTPYNMPVYPGARRIIANALIEALIPPLCACVTPQFRASQNSAAAKLQPSRRLMPD